jgi:hypothetical protein
MRTLEIIHLRSVGESVDTLSERIKKSISDRGRETPVKVLYRRRGLETDLAIHMHSDPTGAAAAHQIALQLASELRAYGLVEHTRWEELP